MAEKTAIIVRGCEPAGSQADAGGQLMVSAHVHSPRARKRAREDEDGLERYLRDLGHRGGAPRIDFVLLDSPYPWHALQGSFVWRIPRRHRK